MALNCFMFLTVWIHLVVACVRAETSCRNELIRSINITAELQPDVLLPCNFNSSLLGSNLTADIAAVWSYINITEDNLLEISLQGVVMFWNNRGGRINPFPKLSTSGNFSILLHKVNKSDLGLYRCELFNGTNCRIAYQEIYLSKTSAGHTAAVGLSTVLITAAAALGGGIVLISLLIITWFCSKRKSVFLFISCFCFLFI
ncbi:hypothetical protein AMEX_G233 [Astyanax mexicanus]|uniref:Ig-like domain-containing protein n=1 Tax=Astyanax mexicanus TaxID=7994 RepID=A0A8T2MIM6_ASTMX|nr:hypothetical protein AMEX_G233 [Astyanax mexicanus]